MSDLVVLPLVIPLGAAIATMPLARYALVQRVVATVAAVAHVAAAAGMLVVTHERGIQATQLGGWPAPFGISLVSDIFGAIMVLLAAIIGLAVIVYSAGFVGPDAERRGYYPLVLFLLAGVSGAFLTGDLFNLYVWFEVLLISSFVLLALEGRRNQVSAAITYVALNLVASVFFLAGLGILYGMAGTLNMADLSVVLREAPEPRMVTIVAMLLLVAFGIKAAMFPLFFWLPASYPTANVAIGALFAGLLTKVGVYALIRVFTLVFTEDAGFTSNVILVASGLTMLTGVLGAVAQTDIRRILSFHIVSQIGYMTMGLGLGTPLALAGSVFYITHHIIVKANLFLIAGVIRRRSGSYELARSGGLYLSAPLLGVLFLIPALSLAGMPPLSGFFAKFILVRAGIEEGSYAIVAVALFVGLLTLLSMTKIWAEAFWKERPDTGILGQIPAPPAGPALMVPIIALAAITLVLGIGAEPFVDLSIDASEQLFDTEAYIAAVQGVEQ